jgi:hypothetical protein
MAFAITVSPPYTHLNVSATIMTRPPLPESKRRSEVFQLRLTKGERTELDEGAAAVEEPLSEFIRTAALDKAKRAKKKTPPPKA